MTIDGATPMKDTETSAARMIAAFLEQPARQEGNVQNKDNDDHDDDSGVTKVPLTLDGAAFQVGGITHKNDEDNDYDKGPTGDPSCLNSTYSYQAGRP